VLVVAQVALGVLLLVGAGLMLRTLARIHQVDPGYRPEGALTFRVSLPWSRYGSHEQVMDFSRQLEQRLAALPGVQAAGAVHLLPLDRLPNWSTPYAAEGAGEAEAMREADARAVSPGYLRAAGATLLEGRWLAESDQRGAQPAVVVDDVLARRLWPGQSAVGRRVQVQFLIDGEFTPTWTTIVGVVQHMRHRQLTEVVREQIYVPHRQSPRNPMAYVVRTSGDPLALAPAVRAEVAALDRNMPVFDVRPLSDYVAGATSGARFTAVLAGLFAAVALAMACIGVYGVIAYSVGRRRQELGVRMALGARRVDVFGLILREGLALAVLGLGLGLGGALLLSGWLQGLLYGVGRFDPASYAAAGGLVLATAALATVVPAARATAVPPSEVLAAD
jgi:predicted permease